MLGRGEENSRAGRATKTRRAKRGSERGIG
jgi:hypothetical protein